MQTYVHRRITIVALIATLLSAVGLSSSTGSTIAAEICGATWNGSVGGIGAHGNSCLDWPTQWTYTGYGTSWTDGAMDNLGTKNQGGETCDGTFYWNWDTGWQWAGAGATWHRAQGSAAVRTCTQSHAYYALSTHFFDEAGYNQTPQTSKQT